MSAPPLQLPGFDSAAFLRDIWQKRPALIRNPWADWSNPVAPDELAGLACEEGIESRLIEQSSDAIALEDGPLPPVRFGALGKQPWTLLVQSVDHHVPEVAALREPFRFLPDWRIDDVMVSYANDGGGVGAHFDQYDVFLIQGLGRRRWQIGGLCDESTPLLPHDGLRLLADFEALEEWILEPGDILYVPPRFAHNGVAVGDDCMTYSVGFRAPSRRELVAGWSESILSELDDDDRYTDPDPLSAERRGEIGGQALDRLQAMVAEALLDRENFARWFGRYTTLPRNTDIDWRPEEMCQPEQAQRMLSSGAALLRNPAMRFAFVRHDAGGLDLFVDGECFACTGMAADFAEMCCADDRIEGAGMMAASAPALALITDLLNLGAITFEAEG